MQEITTTVPPCPDWCRFGPHDWDSVEPDGRRSRGHDGGDWPSVPVGDDYLSVSVTAGAFEVQGEPVGPVSVHLEAPGVQLTASQARQLAAPPHRSGATLRRTQPTLVATRTSPDARGVAPPRN
jgi:hypothetical protein